MRIYFYTDGFAIKVGQSINEERRGKELQTGNPSSLTLLGVIETNIITETHIKNMLSRWQCSGGTEWFYPIDEVVNYVAECLDIHPVIIKTKIKGGRKHGPLVRVVGESV